MKLSTATFLTTIALAAVAHAAKPPASQQAYVVPYLGYFDVIDGQESAAQLGVEYRAKSYAYNIRPGAGINVTSDGSAYGYVGAFWDVPMLSNGVYLTPNFAVGAYRKGSGKKLGGPIEFRSGIELSYVLPNSARVGVAFNHISNASMYDRNPGAETVLVNYHMPVNW